MRIISGRHKGRRIIAPKHLPVRPTTDRAKEALFNILNNRIYFDEVKVLDLYSGIGSISLEFASRGTEDITAVDKHRGCINFLRDTAEKLELQIKCMVSDVKNFLERTDETYSIIFADPPYGISLEEFNAIINLIFERELLHDDGICIIEHSKYTDLSNSDYYNITKTYGSSAFSFLSK